VRSLGEEIGAQLGQIIAESVQRALVESIDVNAIAQSLGAAPRGRRGRRPATGARAVCSEPGCGKPVLAKGLCRSHYYRARYRAQKAGQLPSQQKRLKRGRAGKAAAGNGGAEAPART
jgi:hypothetical protein